MADEQHVALIKQGASAWNEWRASEPLAMSELSHAVLCGTNLFGADLRRANLMGADLAGVNLTAADIFNANLIGANLSGAVLSPARLVRANLQSATLDRAEMVGAQLLHANLSKAVLSDANLTGANLTDANLTRVDLSGANITKADLTDADLADADLAFSKFLWTNLAGANLTRAIFFETVLADVDLSKTGGLESIRHSGPSTGDHRTLPRSGPLPLAFLRGCGLPDGLVDYLPSLLKAKPIQFYSCFISYSTANEEFAKRLHADLQSHGVRCWFAPHDMESGKRIHDQIDAAIRVHDRLLLILSSESMSSRWVRTEIEGARAKELRLNRNVLFPLALVPFSQIQAWRQFDADLGEDTAKAVREYFIPDFSGWETDHSRYLASFEKLLTSLKSADSKTAGGEAAGAGRSA